MFSLVKKSLLGIAVGSLLSTSVLASPEEKIKERVSSLVSTEFGVEVKAIGSTGIYEVVLGSEVLYMTEDANYLVMGNLVDLRTRDNLTENTKTKARKKILDTLDVSSMIEFSAKGKVKHIMTVFTDIDCPYCKKFHKEVPKLNEAGITVRYLAFPRSGIDTPSFKKMEAIWCADDQVKAMDEMKNKNKLPSSKACSSPIKQHLTEVRKLSLNGTPALLFEDGNLVPGYVPAEEIIKGLGL